MGIITYQLIVAQYAKLWMIKKNMIEYDDCFDPSRQYIVLANGHRSNNIVTLQQHCQVHIVNSTGKNIDFILKNALLAPTFPLS